jgi:hypothetical protein
LHATKSFLDDNLILNRHYYNISPHYCTTFENFNFIDDNDDYDKWVDDNTEGQLPGWGDSTNPGLVTGYYQTRAYPGTMFNFYYDHDADGTFDRQQMHLFFVAEHPYFWHGEDRNNNWIVDRYEDDTLPDHPYRKDLIGNELSITYKFAHLTEFLPSIEEKAGFLISPFSITYGKINEQAISNNNLYNRVSYINFGYKTKFAEEMVNLNIKYQLKKVKDTYPDDLVEYEDFGGKDNLDFKNSNYNTLVLSTEFKPLKKMTLSNFYKSITNHKLTDDKLQRWTGISSKIEYKYKLPEKVYKHDPSGILKI